MLREQMITYLQAVVVFLLLTNALSIFAAMYAMRLAKSLGHKAPDAPTAVERRLDVVLRRAA